MFRFCVLLILFIGSVSLNAQSSEAKEIIAVNAVLELQKKAWNEGDLEGFMAHYWNSPNLKFVGSQGVEKGWDATLERYKKAYPDQAAMGKLNFEIKSAEVIAKKTVSMTGKYILLVNERNLVGYFHLLWQKKGKDWVIILDSTN